MQKWFYSKVGDTAIAIRAKLTDSRTITWSLGSVVFSARDIRTAALHVNREAVTIIDPVARIVQYQPVAGSAGVIFSGIRRCEFENTEPGGGIATYPNVDRNALFWQVIDALD